MADGELVPVDTGTDVRVFTRAGGRPLAAGRDPERMLDAETEAMYWEGFPETTRAIYAYQWRRFVDWCADDRLGPPHPVESMPATPETVAKYIRAHQTWTNAEGVLAGRNGQAYAPDTVRLALAVISIVHGRHGLASPTRDDGVTSVMRSYAKRWRKAGYKRDVAYAPTPDEIIAMVNACDLTTCAGLRDALLIRTQAEIGRRNAEMMDMDIADLSFRGPDRLIIDIPFSKTNQDGERQDQAMVEADTIWHPETCPVVLMREWLQLLAARGFTDGPLFRKIHSGQRRKDGTRSGRILPERMGRKNYQDVVTRAAKVAEVDHDPFTGEARQVVPHSMRAAFATNGSAAGVQLGIICDQGGWSRKSPVVLEYQRAGNRWGDNNPGRAIREHANRDGK